MKQVLCTGIIVMLFSIIGIVPVFSAGHLEATYLGGSDLEGEFYGAAVAVDAEGSVYAVGKTRSVNIPVTAGAYCREPIGKADIVIAKFSPDLSTLLACTYLGGTKAESLGRDRLISVDGDGKVYVAVVTLSDDFPMAGTPFDDSRNGGYDIAVARFSNDLSTLEAATFLGSSDYDMASSMVLSHDGSVYIAGITRGNDYPVSAGAFDESFNGNGSTTWGGDIIVSRLSADLSDLLASTYLGGIDWEYGGHLELDSDGNVFVTGGTRSTDFPTTPGVFSESHAGISQALGADTFIAKLNGSLTQLLASSFLGGTMDDWGYTLTIAPDDAVYVTGHTSSETFPVTSSAYDTTFNGVSGMDVGDDVFIARFNNDLTDLEACTYIGGTHWDAPGRIFFLPGGDVIVAGQCGSLDFPVTDNAFQTGYAGGNYNYGGEVFISRFDAMLETLKACTLFGGSGTDGIGSAVLMPAGDIVLAGITNSSDLPGTATGADATYNGGESNAEDGDLFLMRMDAQLKGPAAFTATPTPLVTPTPLATATPEIIWYTFEMPDTQLQNGDLFLINRHCGNPEPGDYDVDEYIILDIQGIYWFWPSWNQTGDCLNWTLAGNSADHAEILKFQWPQIDMALSGIRFWGGMVEHETVNLMAYTWVDWGFE